jgi:excisionase family DNA binding protein
MTLDIVTLESPVFLEMKRMHEENIRLVAKLAQENAANKVPKWLTTKQAAEYLAISVSTLQKYQDKIRYSYSFGGDKRFTYKALDKFMMEHYTVERPNFKLRQVK